MDTSTVITVTGTFFKFVGETLAEVKRQDLAYVDAESLRLKRTVLAEKLEEFKTNLNSGVKKDKGMIEQDLNSRGLGNFTVRQSFVNALERDAATEHERASREYNRAIEEIALIERKVEVQNRPSLFRQFIRWCRARLKL